MYSIFAEPIQFISLWKIGETALMWAADEGQVAVVELLLEADADKDAQSEVRDPL